MKRYIIIGLLFSTSAFAQAPAPAPQQPTFTVTVTAQELDAIGNALGKAPFEVAAPIIQKLREQVIAQSKSVDNPEKK